MSEQAAGSQPADSRPIGDRIANVFGDIAGVSVEESPNVEASSEAPDQTGDTAAATSEGDPSTASEYAEVEYEGERYQVPPKLKDAIIRQSDYTQKTQRLAEERRALEHAQQQIRERAMAMEFQAVIAPQAQQYAQIDALIRQKAQVDLSMLTPDELARTQLEITQLNLYKDQLARSIQETQARFTQQREQTLTQVQAKAVESLRAMVPQWSEVTQKAVLEHALNDGYTQEELSDLYDPRYVRTLWKAAQYDALQRQARPAAEQAKNLQVKGSKPMPNDVKDKLNWRRAMAKAPEGSQERRKLVEARVGNIFGR